MAVPKVQKEKNKVGRPPKYNPGIVPLVSEYLKSCGREATELPTLEGLAEKLDVCVETISEWQRTHPEFSQAVKRIKQRQKNQLMNDGLFGGKEVNCAMAIFLLKVNHGLVETSRFEGEIKATPYENLSDKELDELLEKKFGSWQRDKERSKQLLESKQEAING